MAYKFHNADPIQKKKKRCIKPFIDENLQMQFPPSDNPDSIGKSAGSLFSHYSSNKSYLAFREDKQAIDSAMHNAEQAYDNWKRLQDKIQSALSTREL